MYASPAFLCDGVRWQVQCQDDGVYTVLCRDFFPLAHDFGSLIFLSHFLLQLIIDLGATKGKGAQCSTQRRMEPLTLPMRQFPVSHISNLDLMAKCIFYNLKLYRVSRIERT